MRNLVYVKVSKGKLEVRTFDNGEKDEVFLCSALNHPRTLANNFNEVEAAFLKVIKSQPNKFFGLIKPNILVHLIEKVSGGYTDSELRFFSRRMP